MKTTIRAWTGAAVALAALGGVPGSAAAQDASQGWFAFLGCWEPDSGAGPTMCIRPTLDGVELSRIADGQVVSVETLSTRAQGTESEAEGCVGVHHAAFSADRQRVMLTSDFTCEGGGTRRETGILALLDADVLLDVRSLDLDDEPVAWTQSYRAASPSVGQELGIADLPLPGMALESARRAATRTVDIADVTEALDVVGPGAVEAWVAETGDRFPLDASTLVALSDQGVPESVIDLMIAVSYPDQFALNVDDRGPAYMGSGSDRGDGPYLGARGGPSAFSCYGYGSRFSPLYYDPFYSGCGYRYSRYSYGPYGYAGGWYGTYSPPVVYIGTGSGASNDNGRVVRGRGYTRGGSGSGTTTGSGSSGSVGSTRTGGSSSGGASAGSSSGGSSSGGTVRRAKPRGGGGGLF